MVSFHTAPIRHCTGSSGVSCEQNPKKNLPDSGDESVVRCVEPTGKLATAATSVSRIRLSIMGRSSRVPLIGTLAVAFAIVLAWALATRGDRRASMSREVARSMRLGEEFATRLERRLTGPGDSLSAIDAIAATYLERLRLGLGSPFRLIDYALADRMLSDSVRRLVAYAVLGRTLDGDTYHAPAPALMMAGTQVDTRAEIAARHIAVIDQAVASADDPRAGELAVREAYRLAVAAGSVGRRGPWLGTQAAALARDRELARRDVARLLEMAARNRIDPLGLIPVWRLERRFSVERPLMEPLTPPAERDALEGVPALVRQIDSLAAEERRLAADTAHLTPATPARVSESTARRLAWVVFTRAAPPQAPVTVAVTSTVRPGRLSNGSPSDHVLREGLTRFAQRAVNDEALAAEYALFSARD